MASRTTAGRGAESMGSRADMISLKIDEVARNQIWRKHIKKEAKLERPVTEFHFNPHKLSTVAIKPTQCDPRESDGNLETETCEIQKLIKESAKEPQEKSDSSMTEAQEIGWLHKNAHLNGREKLNSQRPCGRTTCDVTKFADAYCTMSGCNPFADKSTR